MRKKLPAIYDLQFRNGANLEFTYSRSLAAMGDGVSFNVEWRDDLTTGTWIGAGVTEKILGSNGTVQTVRATLPAGTGGKRVVHLRVSRP